jgi:hypothetical protein
MYNKKISLLFLINHFAWTFWVRKSCAMDTSWGEALEKSSTRVPIKHNINDKPRRIIINRISFYSILIRKKELLNQ